MPGGAPKGNNNAGKNKPWRDAIDWAVKNHPTSKVEQAQALREVATKLIDSALGGDLQAMKELGDRLDGRAPQSVDLSGELHHTHEAWLESLGDE